MNTKENCENNCLMRSFSHDIRSILTGIIGNSTIYLEKNQILTEEEKTSIISSILEDSSQMLNMFENLLIVVKMMDGELPLRKEMESLEEVISEAIYKITLRYPDIVVKASVPDKVLFLYMDALLVEQLLINLLECSYLYSDRPKPILINITNNENYTELRITNVEAKECRNMLAAEFKNNPCMKLPKGILKCIRMNFCICKKIITAHKGTISCINTDNGTDIIIQLPLGETRDEPESANTDY